MKYTDAELAYVEEATRLQAQSLVWFEQRAGRITASVAHDCLHTNIHNPSKSLIKKICSDTPSKLNVPAITWGREKEAEAFASYQGGNNSHNSLTVEKSGLVLHQEHTFLAASPDGRVTCHCHGKGLLEIKCPFKFREMTLQEMVQHQDSCLDADFNLKLTHPYYTQVQHQMYVTGASFCDFMVWLPSSPCVVTIFPDDFSTAKVPHLQNFWMQCILPELVSRTLEVAQPSATSSSEIHCSCGYADKNPMVGCDSSDCPHQWFHFACVGLKSKPKSKTWFCPQCKPKKVKGKVSKRKRCD